MKIQGQPVTLKKNQNLGDWGCSKKSEFSGGGCQYKSKFGGVGGSKFFPYRPPLRNFNGIALIFFDLMKFFADFYDIFTNGYVMISESEKSNNAVLESILV